MRTVTYTQPLWRARRNAIAVVAGALLARTRWLGAEFPLVRRTTLFHPSLPEEFDGLRIVQVSDVHAGWFMPPSRLQRVRESVEKVAADLIVFTGDQLDRRDVDADLFVHGFAGIQAPMGVFGILGNHDHTAGPELAVAAMEAVGITPLVNEFALLERRRARLLVAGIDDLEARPGWGPDFSTVRAVPADFRLVLCHQPQGWGAARRAGAEVMLAGHTHGGQIALPTRGLNFARLTTRYIAGPYLKRRNALYVSRGVGVGAVPVRFGAPPEVDLVTIRRGPLAAI